MATGLFELIGALATGAKFTLQARRAVEGFLRRDGVKALLRDLDREIEDRGSDAPTRADAMEQLSRLLIDPELYNPFADAAAGSYDALGIVRAYLAEHLGSESKRGSAEMADIIVDFVAKHVARAQRDPKAAVDAVGRQISERLDSQHRGLTARLDGLTREIAADRPERHIVVHVSLEGAPEGARRALDELGEADAEVLQRLLGILGNPPEPSKGSELLEELPAWVASGVPALHRALARLAELDGRWDLASPAYRRAAEHTAGSVRADYYARAAVAAEVGNDWELRDALLALARQADDTCARLRLVEIEPTTEVDAELAALEDIVTDDEQLAAVIQCQRALALSRKGELVEAAAALEAARKLGAQTLTAQSVAVNLDVQRGRMAVRDGATLNGPELRKSRFAGEELRAQLLLLRRFDEAARMLMLTVDAALLSADRKGARTLLESATDEEARSRSGAEVLADAALRGGFPAEAMRLLELATVDSEGTRRQRASATLYLGSSVEVRAALAELDAIAGDSSSAERELAALARLAIAVERPTLSWSSAAEDALRQAGHERAVVSAQAFRKARSGLFLGAERELRPWLDELWAREQFLRIARMRGKSSLISEAADLLTTAGPDQQARLECGLAFGAVGRAADAKRELGAVAYDNSAPIEVRRRAFKGLLRTVLRADPPDLKSATRALRTWDEIAPHDPDAKSWEVVLANRQRNRAP